ncbi:proline-rich proteoglycan 2-like isoform X2 [Physeter macrocephalus]|uniref:Proline-rich proteoglycan 2-like isoform X2 n=1 Tax=Physeter macrocephalus TaxID=9755 RepID=A0A9W2WIU7_PHYMC|nr:proline-rich proteoglycan 2-like isoform X2 [Physeter catodon]
MTRAAGGSHGPGPEPAAASALTGVEAGPVRAGFLGSHRQHQRAGVKGRQQLGRPKPRPGPSRPRPAPPRLLRLQAPRLGISARPVASGPGSREPHPSPPGPRTPSPPGSPEAPPRPGRSANAGSPEALPRASSASARPAPPPASGRGRTCGSGRPIPTPTPWRDVARVTSAPERKRRPEPNSLPAEMSIGVPIKVLHEAEGHIVTCETNTGEVYRGKLIEAEDNMNCQVSCFALEAVREA